MLGGGIGGAGVVVVVVGDGGGWCVVEVVEWWWTLGYGNDQQAHELKATLCTKKVHRNKLKFAKSPTNGGEN